MYSCLLPWMRYLSEFGFTLKGENPAPAGANFEGNLPPQEQTLSKERICPQGSKFFPPKDQPKKGGKKKITTNKKALS